MSNPTRPDRERRRLCDTRHGYVHVRTDGEGGVPLVLLHFGPYSSLAFRSVLPLFARDRLTITVDRLGFGMSDPAPAGLDMSEYALATLDALDGLGLDHFDVVGVHTGATEAVELATAHGARVRRLVLAGVPIWNDDERDALKRFFQNEFTGQPVEDGSHLTGLWKRMKEEGEGRHTDWRDPSRQVVDPQAPGAGRGWGPDRLQEFILHFLLAGPHWWHAHLAVFDYPLGERLPEVSQPLLVFRLRDDLWHQTGRAVPLLPPAAQFVDLPHLDILAFDYAPEKMATRIAAFVDDACDDYT